MNLLITGGDSRLARALMAALPSETTVCAIDSVFTAPLPSGVEGREGDLRDREFVTKAVRRASAILHLAPLFPVADGEADLLDLATRGTYVLTNAAIDAHVPRFVLGSTLSLFDRLPAHWRVNEWWRPRPEPRLEHLGPWLAELSVRECTRSAALHSFCLRFGEIVDDADIAARPFDPRWVHLEDAVAAVRYALTIPFHSGTEREWRIYHVTAAGPRAKIRVSRASHGRFGYKPTHDFREKWEAEEANPEEWMPGWRRHPYTSTWQEVLAPPHPIPARPIRRVVIFGAGGPVAAALAQELKEEYTLRLTDVRAIAEIEAEGKRQSHGTPLPTPLGAPHECRIVDVRCLDQVMAACEGMDAIINCTVVRTDPVEAFRVNTLGAYHIVRAAVRHGIRRVVQTGPQLVSLHGANDYTWDYDVPGDVPPRPGRALYGHSKYLGQEICRVFADYYDLEVPTLLFTAFINPEVAERLHPMSVSWADAARAIRCALETPSLPSPYEVMHITTDLPHGIFSNRQAKQILGWQPQDMLTRQWQYEET